MDMVLPHLPPPSSLDAFDEDDEANYKVSGGLPTGKRLAEDAPQAKRYICESHFDSSRREELHTQCRKCQTLLTVPPALQLEPGRLVQCSKCKTNFELDWQRAPQMTQSRPEVVPGAVCVRCLRRDDVARCPSCSLVWHSNCAGGWPCPWCVANGGVVSPRPTSAELQAWAAVQGLSVHLQSGSEALLRELYDWAWDRLRLFWLQSQPRETPRPGPPQQSGLLDLPLASTGSVPLATLAAQATQAVAALLTLPVVPEPQGRRPPQPSPAPAKKTPGLPEIDGRPATPPAPTAPADTTQPANPSPRKQPEPASPASPTVPDTNPAPAPTEARAPAQAPTPASTVPQTVSPQKPPAAKSPLPEPVSSPVPPAQPEPSPSPGSSAEPSPSPTPAKPSKVLTSPNDSPAPNPDATSAKKKRARRDLANLSLGMACPYCAYGCYKEHEMLRHLKRKHPESVGKSSTYRPLKPAGPLPSE
jgi:hypothetical protein